jgi:rhamnose transport system substrate-binding protein
MIRTSRRHLLKLAVGAAGASVLPAGLIGRAFAQGDPVRIAMVIKALGISFFDSARAGGEEACKELSARFDRVFEQIFTGPNQATAEEQIQVIQALINQGVDALAIAADDENALVPVAKRAMQRGIKVISWDSPIAQEGRILQVDPTSIEALGARMLELMAAPINHEGEVAILSSTPEQAGQNAWIAAMKEEWKKPEYANMPLVTTVYSGTQFDKGYREVDNIIKAYPNLRGVIAVGTVEHAAAAKVIIDRGLIGKVYTSGLGLPSQMQSAVEAGATQSFALWNNVDLGYSVIMIAGLLVMGEIKGDPNSVITVGRMGEMTIGENGRVVMAPPMTFDKSNIAEFAKLF